MESGLTFVEMFQASSICLLEGVSGGSESMFSGGIFSAAALTSTELTTKAYESNSFTSSIVTPTTSGASFSRDGVDTRPPCHRRAFSDTWTMLNEGRRVHERPYTNFAHTAVERSKNSAENLGYEFSLAYLHSNDRKPSYFMDLDEVPSPTELSCPAVMCAPRKSDAGEPYDSNDFSSVVVRSDGHVPEVNSLCFDFIDGEEIATSALRDIQLSESRQLPPPEISLSRMTEAAHLIENSPHALGKGNSRPTYTRRLSAKGREMKKNDSFNSRTSDDMLMLDPKRVRKVINASRVKDRKFDYAQALAERMSELQSKCESIRTEVESLHHSNVQLSYRNNDLTSEADRLRSDMGRMMDTNNMLVEELNALQASLGLEQQVPMVPSSQPLDCLRPPHTSSPVEKQHRLSSSGQSTSNSMGLPGNAGPGAVDFGHSPFSLPPPQHVHVPVRKLASSPYLPSSNSNPTHGTIQHSQSFTKPGHRRALSSYEGFAAEMSATDSQKRSPSFDGSGSVQVAYCGPTAHQSNELGPMPFGGHSSGSFQPRPVVSPFQGVALPNTALRQQLSDPAMGHTGSMSFQQNSYQQYQNAEAAFRVPAPQVITTSVSEASNNWRGPANSPYPLQPSPGSNYYMQDMAR